MHTCDLASMYTHRETHTRTHWFVMSYPSQGYEEDEAEQRSDNDDITATAVNLVVFEVCYLGKWGP